MTNSMPESRWFSGSPKPSRTAAMRAATTAACPGCSSPILRFFFACCASAETGHAAVAPATSVMNSQAGKGRIDIASGSGRKDFDLLSDGQTCRLRVLGQRVGIGIAWIDQHGNAQRVRQQVMQESEPLGRKLRVQGGDTGDVPARTVKVGDETDFHRIGSDAEDDWN